MIASRDLAKLDGLLAATSRTFGVAIPLLPKATRYDVTVAYLLLRIADTLEDADSLPRSQRVKALTDFRCLLERGSPHVASVFARRWASASLSDREADGRLVAETPFVMRQFWQRSSDVQACIRRHARRTSAGMSAFLSVTRVTSLLELQQYCFYVAGVVGEMLSELFAAAVPHFRVTRAVRCDAQAFGEGLQLVNILKDREEDARRGRVFLPANVSPPDVFDLARKDLRCARRYIETLRSSGAPAGFVHFTELPVALADATLDRLQQHGPGAKVPREQVACILRAVAARSSAEAPSFA